MHGPVQRRNCEGSGDSDWSSTRISGERRRENSSMICVVATREGLDGGKTASGYRIERTVPFVALPSDAALRQWVWVLNPRTQKRVKALVLDVGPWNEKDHQYVFQPGTLDPGVSIPRHSGIRPQA